MIYTAPGVSVEVPALDLASFVLKRAEQRGGRPALIDGSSGRVISYRELAGGVKAVAAGLDHRGFGQGDVLAIYMPNCPEYALALHGALAAGGACTTVNPLYTVRELAHQLRDAGARLLVTAPGFIDTARRAAAQAGVEEVIVVREGDGAGSFGELLGTSGHPPPLAVNPDADLALLPYSSGTTGLPKGVMLSHRNAVSNLCQMQASLPIWPQDRLIGVLPFFHIYGMAIVMNQGLRGGATIVTMPRFDLDRYLDLIEQHAATRLYVVPPIALALANEPSVDRHDLSSVRILQCGGAPLGAELAKRIESRLGCLVLEGYGLTEASPVTHVTRPGGINKPGSIGPPLPATECRLVDPDSANDVARGGRGELWVRGPQVMRGYLGSPQATAAAIDAEGWLHTGDVAEVDADGMFTIVDRIKELIKYKGFQVAPAELEGLIGAHPSVVDAAVVGVPDEECGELPKAFIVAAEPSFNAEELIRWVASQVAPHKRIRLIELVDEIPRSPSGKILRRNLPGQPARVELEAS